MEESKVVTELGTLIDCSEEKFNEYCKDKDLGYLKSFLNLMTQTYNRLLESKQELVSKITSLVIPNNTETQAVLNGIYSKMLRVEQRVFILRNKVEELQKELS